MGININKYQYHYKCIGCGRDIYSKYYYPYGAICNHCRYTIKLKINCSICGTNIEIPWATYYAKYPDGPYFCHECFIKHQSDGTKNQWNNMSSEQYQQQCNIRSINSQNYWDSLIPEERKLLSELRKENWINMPLEKKLQRSEKLSKKAKLRWENMDEKEKESNLKRLFDGNKEWREKLISDPDLYDAYISILSSAQLLRWENIDSEYRMNHGEKISSGLLNHWSNATEEEHKQRSEINRITYLKSSPDYKQKMSSILSEIVLKWWETIPKEKILKRNERISNSLLEYWDNLKDDEFIEIYRNYVIESNENAKNKIIDKNNIDSTELQFLNILEDNDIEYLFHYYNETIYSKFKILFPYNPMRKTSKILPFHQWDFLIRLKNMDIFIDIDGSIHDPNKMNFKDKSINTNYSVADYIKFNDSQRQYQTDGLSAYVIQCYDDKISNDNIVINVSSGSKRTLKEFICLLNNMK